MTVEELREELRWALRARWVIFLLVVVTAAIADRIGNLPVPYAAGSIVLTLVVAFNIGCYLLLDRLSAGEGLVRGPAEGRGIFQPVPSSATDTTPNVRDPSRLGSGPSQTDDSRELLQIRFLCYLQVPFDALFLTLVVHLSGGPSSPYVILYFLAILASAVPLTSSLVYLLAGSLAALYGFLLLVEGIRNTAWPSFFGSDLLEQHPGAQFTSFAVVASLLFATAYFANHIARLLRAQISESDRRANELLALNAVATAVSRSLALNDTLSAGLNKIIEVMSMDVGGIYLVEKGANHLRLAVSHGLHEDSIAEHGILPLGEGYAGLAALSGEILYTNDTRRVPDTAPDLMNRENLLSIGSIPLKAKDEVVGVLYVAGRKPHAFSTGDLKLLESIAGQIGVAIDNARLYSEVERLAITDSLTGLANRRVFREQLERELRLARRLGVSVSLVIIDIDHFKRFNDNYGHLVGDQVLREVAMVVRQAVRASDLTARYGGEEFAVILPDTQAEGGLILSERIREAIAEHRLPIAVSGALPRLTISLGIATYPQHAGTAEDLVAASDAALYLSKQHGRNRSTIFPQEEVKHA